MNNQKKLQTWTRRKKIHHLVLVENKIQYFYLI